MKTLFVDIETIPRPEMRDIASARIEKDYAREGKVPTPEDIDRHMATIPQWCQIVGLGYAIGEAPICSRWVGDTKSSGEKATEADLLTMFWYAVKDANHIVTYNGNYFDLNVIKWRTACLGVPVTRQFYDTKPWEFVSVDTFKSLFPNGAKFMFKLEEVLACIGVELPEELKTDVDGSMVKGLFEAGEIETLRRYNSADIWSTREIARFGSGVYWPRVI